MQVFRYGAFQFEGTHLTRVEIDQRSRDSRRHLEQVEEMLVPRMGSAPSFVAQALHRLHLVTWPVATFKSAYPTPKWE
jgi:hypothetical protein